MHAHALTLSMYLVLVLVETSSNASHLLRIPNWVSIHSGSEIFERTCTNKEFSCQQLEQVFRKMTSFRTNSNEHDLIHSQAKTRPTGKQLVIITEPNSQSHITINNRQTSNCVDSNMCHVIRIGSVQVTRRSRESRMMRMSGSCSTRARSCDRKMSMIAFDNRACACIGSHFITRIYKHRTHIHGIPI